MPAMCKCPTPAVRRGENVCIGCGGMMSYTPPMAKRQERKTGRRAYRDKPTERKP